MVPGYTSHQDTVEGHETDEFDQFFMDCRIMALMVPRIMIAAAISGDVSFWGDSDGIHPIEIAAHTAFDEAPVSAVEVSSPGGAYSLPIVNGSYYISAYLDRDESGAPDPYEPFVWYDANGDGLPDMVTVSGGDVPGIDVDLGFVYLDIDASGTMMVHRGQTHSPILTRPSRLRYPASRYG